MVTKTKLVYAALPPELLRPGTLPAVPVKATTQRELVPYISGLEKAADACEIDRAAIAALASKWAKDPDLAP